MGGYLTIANLHRDRSVNTKNNSDQEVNQVKRTPRSAKLVALLTAGVFAIAACGGSDSEGAASDTTTATATEETEAPAVEETEAPTEETEAPTEETEAPVDTEAPTAEAAMRVTYQLADTAVWSDGEAISAADFECTWNASVNTPESISTVGYDQIISVTGEGSEVVVDFGVPYAPWKTLFGVLLQASQHEDCNDVSADFEAGPFTYGANVYAMTAWTPEQIVFEANPGYKGPNVPKSPKIVIVPAEDGSTLLKAGTVDVIVPQSYTGLAEELTDPNIASDAEGGGSFEALYFQQADSCTPDETRSCAFNDDAFREAFSKSIDLQGVYDQIYAPFAAGLPLLECGPIAPGPYCDPIFTDTFDPEGAAGVLEAAGWAKNGDGMWAKPDGSVPEVHWMVNTGNTRRESTQEFLIPKMAELGFNVIADNCEALPCVFETRLPAMQYDLAMYINTVAPDPVYLTAFFSCDQIPDEENDFQGQNNLGWCNQAASDGFNEADRTLDEAARTALVKTSLQATAADFALLPTLQFPNVSAYRTDKTAGTQNNIANYWGFADMYNFEDVDGDGQVVIGAEQFPTPDCTNPITACANSTWYVWTTSFPQFPGAYATTNDQTFIPGEILAGEATVEVL
jgi:peptide/nickel transport system substrate-binding protein